jgi:hypothetical protein
MRAAALERQIDRLGLRSWDAFAWEDRSTATGDPLVRYCATQPPSSCCSDPVMQEAASEVR